MTLFKKGSTLQTWQGDSFTITFNLSNLEEETNYDFYFEIKGTNVKSETKSITSDDEGKASVEISIYHNQTKELIPVKYKWGLKACHNHLHDTVAEGDFIVLPERVTGEINE